MPAIEVENDQEMLDQASAVSEATTGGSDNRIPVPLVWIRAFISKIESHFKKPVPDYGDDEDETSVFEDLLAELDPGLLADMDEPDD